MADVYLGLGSNLGDKLENLRAALRLLAGAADLTEGQAGIFPKIRAISSLYRTEPVGYREQDWFLNAAAHVATGLSPHELLARLLVIEQELGRVRTIRNGPRTIDLDILLWDDLVLGDSDLIIPHPRLHERLFVLAPLAEIAPDMHHPMLRKTIAACRDDLVVRQGSQPGVQRVAGPEWAGAPFQLRP